MNALRIAGCLAERLVSLSFSGAASAEHFAVNRAHVGTLRAAFGREFQEWRPSQVADFARLTGTCRYGPSQTEDNVAADLRALLDTLEAEHPGLKADLFLNHRIGSGGVSMKPFESASGDPAVLAVAQAFRKVRNADELQGAIRPSCFDGPDASHRLHVGGTSGVVCKPGGRYNTTPDERVDRVTITTLSGSTCSRFCRFAVPSTQNSRAR